MKPNPAHSGSPPTAGPFIGTENLSGLHAAFALPPSPPPCSIPQCQQRPCLFTAEAFNVPSDQLLIGPAGSDDGNKCRPVPRWTELAKFAQDLPARKCTGHLCFEGNASEELSKGSLQQGCFSGVELHSNTFHPKRCVFLPTPLEFNCILPSTNKITLFLAISH